MKKLFFIGSTIVAFSAVSYFANANNNNNTNGQGISAKQFSLDTVPKKDTTKKRDSVTFQIKERK